MGSSPHTRGALLRGDAFRGVPGIIPAYAGSTADLSGRRRLGEGSSPHTRGAPRPSLPRLKVLGIIPAYAGSTSRSRDSPSFTKDHPRIRGEHPSAPSRTLGSSGSSPHTRGALVFGATQIHALRIIPAYAGST